MTNPADTLFEAIHLSSNDECLKQVKLARDMGMDWGAQDKGGLTILHHAVKRRQRSLVKYLIKHGADINAEDYQGRTPLHCLATKGRFTVSSSTLIKFIPFLLAYGPKIDHQDHRGRTVLHESLLAYDLRVAELLLELGANPLVADKHGVGSAHFHQRLSMRPWMEQAQQQGLINVEVEARIQKMDAYFGGRYTIPRTGLIVEMPPKQPGECERLSDGRSVLHAAIDTRQIEIVKAAIRAGYRLDLPNKEGFYPYEHAAYIFRPNGDAIVRLVAEHTPKDVIPVEPGCESGGKTDTACPSMRDFGGALEVRRNSKNSTSMENSNDQAIKPSDLDLDPIPWKRKRRKSSIGPRLL